MSDDWETPKWLLDLVFNGREFFDPCPLFGKQVSDGLRAEWPTDRPVFINPPYSRPAPWVNRAVAHPGEVHLLLPMDPAAEWWELNAPEFKVVILPFRLRFRGHFAKGQRTLPGDRALTWGQATFRGTSFACPWWRKEPRARSAPKLPQDVPLPWLERPLEEGVEP